MMVIWIFDLREREICLDIGYLLGGTFEFFGYQSCPSVALYHTAFLHTGIRARR